ncbi:tRNA1(Val) (adenine(37)-N6)-methyltransferase [Actinobacillus equuli]|uniref:tRNA1(Val) (adenine(37)-N6)-methyltransferase n=1 Tax=Actinobacillus equuli TaxID=718 RepID=A0AAX3FIY1_ACTEU|nr:methyltransferase [Actinobacillus equuli]AIZ79795.1 tRNA (adenine-N6)-methyltransferase [Actinobacillus equuli subsp. equuli]WGE43906.1 methyltransferase [Actinobacillus equuli subsp. equuli]VEE90667.1 type 12 methyltransferase [Actinobacillus equuli]
MSKSQGFQFKQFFIAHDKCAMKVNTDGILLGASADVAGVDQILDLGTGTGLVAVMLAQRTVETTQITALELDLNAYQQAVENCQNSAFSDRLQVYQGDVLQHHFAKKFDLIVSNPPYFADSLASRSHARDLARAATQSHLAWLLQAKQWLSEQGEITFILPFDAAEKLRVQSQTSGLFCTKICKIITKQGQQPKRMIVSFSLRNVPLKAQELVIYNSDNQYTEAFKQLTKAFYLNM